METVTGQQPHLRSAACPLCGNEDFHRSMDGVRTPKVAGGGTRLPPSVRIKGDEGLIAYK
jgi:hypothetical protein